MSYVMCLKQNANFSTQKTQTRMTDTFDDDSFADMTLQ